jgi:hypothetical protein
MPTYAFICNPELDGCNQHYDVEVPMSKISEYKAKCPKCKKSVSYQDFSGQSTFGPNKTLGSLADKNNDRMSDDEKKFLNLKNNAYRKKDKDISEEQVIKSVKSRKRGKK